MSSVRSLRIERISVSSEETFTTANDTHPECFTSESLLSSFAEPSIAETCPKFRQGDDQLYQAQLRTELSFASNEPHNQTFPSVSARDNSQQHNGNIYNVTYNITYSIRLLDNEPETLTKVVHRSHFPGGGSPTQEVVTNRIDDISLQLDRAKES